jgi:hypothetical protein
VDENSGDQGGVAEGIFEFWWRGETLYARNNAVGDSYLFAWSNRPEEAAAETAAASPGLARQLPSRRRPAFLPVARRGFCGATLPGDDGTPDRFVTFWCDGSCGLYIHPKIWHGVIVPLADHTELLDRLGRVHARVSVDFAREFGCCLTVPLRSPGA